MSRFGKVEPVIFLLCWMMFFYTGVIIFCEYRFQSDGVVFAVFSGILNNCAGALFMRVKSEHGSGKETGGDDNSTVVIAAAPKPVVPPVAGQ